MNFTTILNSAFIPNYGERYGHGEAISSSLAESTVNEIVSRRMAKKQQMIWTQKGAHLLLQVRTKTLNNEIRDSFKNWYPKMDQNFGTSYLWLHDPQVLNARVQWVFKLKTRSLI